MRMTLILALCAASLPTAVHGAYEEVRELTLPVDTIEVLKIDAGSGSLDVIGVSGLREIEVTATVYVPGSNDDKARKKVEEKMDLTLIQENGVAELNAHFRNGFWGFGNLNAIHLEVRIPNNLDLAIRDGVGSVKIQNVRGNLSLTDGTGHITLQNVGGNVTVKDGTGAIEVSGVGGDISVKDGTGRINIRDVDGGVVIDDGAGSIYVANVKTSLVIVNAGAGRVRYANINGLVDQ
jgi:hypothetical protein